MRRLCIKSAAGDEKNEYLIPFVKDKGGETFSLFTNSRINCKFYEKNGFSLFQETAYEYKGKSIGSWSYRKEMQ